MKIEIDWKDLVDIEVNGGTSTVAYVTSAFSTVLDRELTEAEKAEANLWFDERRDYWMMDLVGTI